MSELSGSVCLESIVDEILNDQFNGERGRYFQMLKWVVRVCMELKMQILIDKKVVKVEIIDEPYCMVLPNDYVKFHAVGLSKLSKFMPFHKSHARTLATTEDCGQETQSTDEATPTPDAMIQQQLFNNPYYTYTLEEHNNRILIDGYPKITEAVLIYQSTGVNTGKETYVPIKAMEAIIAGVHVLIAKHITKTNFDYTVALQTYQAKVNLLGKMQISIKNLYEVARDVYLQKLLA